MDSDDDSIDIETFASLAKNTYFYSINDQLTIEVNNQLQLTGLSPIPNPPYLREKAIIKYTSITPQTDKDLKELLRKKKQHTHNYFLPTPCKPSIDFSQIDLSNTNLQSRVIDTYTQIDGFIAPTTEQRKCLLMIFSTLDYIDTGLHIIGKAQLTKDNVGLKCMLLLRTFIQRVQNLLYYGRSSVGSYFDTNGWNTIKPLDISQGVTPAEALLGMNTCFVYYTQTSRKVVIAAIAHSLQITTNDTHILLQNIHSSNIDINKQNWLHISAAVKACVHDFNRALILLNRLLTFSNLTQFIPKNTFDTSLSEIYTCAIRAVCGQNTSLTPEHIHIYVFTLYEMANFRNAHQMEVFKLNIFDIEACVRIITSTSLPTNWHCFPQEALLGFCEFLDAHRETSIYRISVKPDPEFRIRVYETLITLLKKGI